jgi:toxin-antitoxin system PIN domain toxin
MILVDANLLLYAEDSASEHHVVARQWWDAQLSWTEPVLLCWPVLKAYIRIGTNPRILRRPLTIQEACERVRSWLDQPCVRLIGPTDQHWLFFERMLKEGKAPANLVSDAHLAALTLEHNCVLQTTDRDFARFPGLKWENPIVR